MTDENRSDVDRRSGTDRRRESYSREDTVTLRTVRPRGGIGKSEDQRMSGEWTGLGLTGGVAAGGRL